MFFLSLFFFRVGTVLIFGLNLLTGWHLEIFGWEQLKSPCTYILHKNQHFSVFFPKRPLKNLKNAHCWKKKQKEKLTFHYFRPTYIHTYKITFVSFFLFFLHLSLMRIVIITVVNEQGHHGRYQLPGISKIISQNEFQNLKWYYQKNLLELVSKSLGGPKVTPGENQ